MTAARVMPCRSGGACSTTRPSEPSDRREDRWHARKDSNLRLLKNPVLETGALTAELRACGRRDRDRTDGLLRFRQALYAC